MSSLESVARIFVLAIIFGVRSIRLAKTSIVVSFVSSLLLSTPATAGTIAVGSATSIGVIGASTDPVVLPITFAGDGSTVGVQAQLRFDSSVLDASVVGDNGGNCAVNDESGTIIVIVVGELNAILPTATTPYCRVTFTFTADVGAPATLPLDLSFPTAAYGCFDSVPQPVSCALLDGAIDIATNSFHPIVTYAPNYDDDGVSDASPELVLSSVPIGSVSDASTTPRAEGGTAVGSTAMACTASSGFSIVDGGTQRFDGPASMNGQPIRVQTVLTGAIRTGTLTCTETYTPLAPARVRIWDLIAPSGELPGDGEIITSPPTGSAPIELRGLPGEVVATQIRIANQSLNPVTLRFCEIGGSTATVLKGVTSPIAPGNVGAINVACTVPASGVALSGLFCITDSPVLPQYAISVECSALISGTNSRAIPVLSSTALSALALTTLIFGLVFAAHRHRHQR